MTTTSRNDRLTRNVWLNLAKNAVQIRILTPACRNFKQKQIKREEPDDDYQNVCGQTFVDKTKTMKDLSSAAEENCLMPQTSDDDPLFSKIENMPDIPLDVSVSHVEASSLTTATVSASVLVPTNERSPSAPSSSIYEDCSNGTLPEYLRACGSVKTFLPKMKSSDDRVRASTESESYILRTLTPNSESSYPDLSSYDRLDALKILCRPSNARTPRQSNYLDYCSNYKKKRERNNLAVKRCREKSRLQRQLIASENARLTEENERIRKSLAVALRDVEAYRQKCNYLQELINANRISPDNIGTKIPNKMDTGYHPDHYANRERADH